MKKALFEILKTNFKITVTISAFIVFCIVFLIIVSGGSIFFVENGIYPMCVKPKQITYLDAKNIAGDKLYNSGLAACYCTNDIKGCNNSIVYVIKPTDKVQLLYFEIGHERNYDSFKVKINNKTIGFISKTGNPSIDAMQLYHYPNNPSLSDPDKLFGSKRIRILCSIPF